LSEITISDDRLTHKIKAMHQMKLENPLKWAYFKPFAALSFACDRYFSGVYESLVAEKCGLATQITAKSFT